MSHQFTRIMASLTICRDWHFGCVHAHMDSCWHAAHVLLVCLGAAYMLKHCSNLSSHSLFMVCIRLQVTEKVARIGFVAGTIPSDKVMPFERLLFRATRGNMYLRDASVGKVKDPITAESVDKHVFVIFFAGDRARFKVMKVGHVYKCVCMLLRAVACGKGCSVLYSDGSASSGCWASLHTWGFQ